MDDVVVLVVEVLVVEVLDTSVVVAGTIDVVGAGVVATWAPVVSVVVVRRVVVVVSPVVEVRSAVDEFVPGEDAAPGVDVDDWLACGLV